LPGDIKIQIAHFNIFFNINITIIFLPLIPFIYRLITKVFPHKKKKITYTVNLNDNLLEIPDEALNQSKREIVRLGTHVKENMIMKLNMFIKGGLDSESIFQVEKTIDESYIKIQKYLLKLGQQNLSSYQSIEEVKLLNILNDIENIGDTVVSFIKETKKVNLRNIHFTDKDIGHIKTFLTYIEETYQNSLKAFETVDHQIARRTIQSKST